MSDVELIADQLRSMSERQFQSDILLPIFRGHESMNSRIAPLFVSEDKLRESSSARNEPRSGITLVAFYGDAKPANLDHLVAMVADQLPPQLRRWVQLMPRKQVHGTIAGLEGNVLSDGSVLHQNLLARRPSSSSVHIAPIDFEGLLSHLRQFKWPIDIQFGGVHPNTINPHDQNRKPFQRCFSVQDNGLLTAIGWPLTSAGKLFDPALARLRKSLESFNIIHKYHTSPRDLDNDFFAVLGSIDINKWSISSEDERNKALRLLSKFTCAVRSALSHRRLIVQLAPECLFIVRYDRLSLAEVSFCRQISDISPEELKRLYEPGPLQAISSH